MPDAIVAPTVGDAVQTPSSHRNGRRRLRRLCVLSIVSVAAASASNNGTNYSYTAIWAYVATSCERSVEESGKDSDSDPFKSVGLTDAVGNDCAAKIGGGSSFDVNASQLIGANHLCCRMVAEASRCFATSLVSNLRSRE